MPTVESQHQSSRVSVLGLFHGAVSPPISGKAGKTFHFGGYGKSPSAVTGLNAIWPVYVAGAVQAAPSPKSQTRTWYVPRPLSSGSYASASGLAAVSCAATTVPSRTSWMTLSFAVSVASTATAIEPIVSVGPTIQGPLSGAHAPSSGGTAPVKVSAAGCECSTMSRRIRTSPVAASTKCVYARVTPSRASRKSVSKAGRTPRVGVGTATRRARWGSARPETAISVQPPACRVARTSTIDLAPPTSRAAISHASAALRAGRAASTVSAVSSEETYAMRLPSTPTVSSPPSAAVRPSNVCRNTTACPFRPIRASRSSSSCESPRLVTRKSTFCAPRNSRAISTAEPPGTPCAR